MCSLALIIAGATSFYVRGEKNFGVDFRGGDLITLSSPQTIDVGQVRAALAPINLADASIQESNQAGKITSRCERRCTLAIRSKSRS
jgi:preprotein translocase subunit SecF